MGVVPGSPAAGWRRRIGGPNAGLRRFDAHSAPSSSAADGGLVVGGKGSMIAPGSARILRRVRIGPQCR
jgi:hypothetical protein